MVYNNNIIIDSVTKKNIDTTLLMLGRELILSNESLIFYHSSSQKINKINNLGNWFSPIKIKENENYYTKHNIYPKDIPLWYGFYDFRFINKKPLKLLVIKTYTNDFTYYKLKTMISIINNTIQLNIIDELNLLQNTNNNNNDEDRHFLLGQEKDPEYLLAYNLCKYSSFDGWITDASYLGFCMLKQDCLKKLKLLSVTEPLNSDDTNDSDNITMYYTSKQWNEQFI